MENSPYLSVIIAAYNESCVIAANVQKVLSFLASTTWSWELICVNDGSRDDTGTLLDIAAENEPKLVVLHHRRNFGQGQALRTGFAFAQGEIIVTLDADLSYGPEHIALLVNALEKAPEVEIALASAYMKGGKAINVPFYRYFLSRVGNWYLGRMFDYSLSTSTCVVRAYRREVLSALRLNHSGMEMQLEVLAKAAVQGFNVIEVPAVLCWEKEKAAEASFRRTSKMRILRSIRMYLMLGWLAKPAFILFFLSFLFLLPGMYMAGALCYRFFEKVALLAGMGMSQRISEGFSLVFAEHTYTIVFCSIFVFLGLQMFIFSLLFLQAKYYNEELYRSAVAEDASVRLAPRKHPKTSRKGTVL